MKRVAYTDILNVVRFFMNLYRLQVGAQKEDPSEFKFIGSAARDSDHTYELRVRFESAWSTKRITVSPLGEASSSKSKCFKVTYGNNLVIKIPPQPISDYQTYIRAVGAERRVASILSPEIECIAPSISAFLKQIPHFHQSIKSPEPQHEKHGIQWLKQFREYQDYLKIGGSFVFFMDLSKHFFLSHAIEQVHAGARESQEIRKEITAHCDMLWDFVKFEGRYGIENTAVFLKMREVYSNYERKMDLLCAHHQITANPPSYLMIKWFVEYLVGQRIRPAKSVAPTAFFSDLNILLSEVMKQNRPSIQEYIACIQAFLYDKSFSRNRSRIEGLATAILELLARLNEKKVAIRDLKPDNLFIVAKPSRANLHLESPETYSLGLIDFETAVFMGGPGPKAPAQPRLGGTAAYATPSHFVVNSLLQQAFDNSPRILALQDWQAVIGMLYFVSTGEPLFQQAKNLLPEINKIMQSAIQQNRPLYQAFKHYSRVYWHAATAEFKENLSRRKSNMTSIQIALPEGAANMLRAEVLRARKRIDARIEMLGRIFPRFEPCGGQTETLETMLRVLHQNQKRFVSPQFSQGADKAARYRIRQLIEEVGELSLRSQKNELAFKMLQDPQPVFSSFELLYLMFGVVARAMCFDQWGMKLTNADASKLEEASEDTFQATI